MNVNNDIDIIFLSKLQQALDTLDEIDDMIKDNPDNQQKIDYEISDYLHLIQNTDCLLYTSPSPRDS